MGNSCVSCASVQILNTPKIRVVQAVEGRVVDITSEDSIKVGELMLEFPPGHFVAQLDIKADQLLATASGKRASPLGADADAKPGSVYVVLPMPRLHTHITRQELLTFAQLLHRHDQDQHFAKAASKVAPRRPHARALFSAGARVAPLSEGEVKHDSLEAGDGTHEQASAFLQSTMQQDTIFASSTFTSCQIQVLKSKPWAPKLETIHESA